MLIFKSCKILAAHTLRPTKMRHRVKFCADRSNLAEIWPFLVFLDGGRPPSWICYTPVWANHEVYFGGLCHCAKFGLNR